jgi:predicted Rossmann fold flavoprotein
VDDPAGFAEALEQIVLESGVEIRTSFALESISRQPDGSYRIWSRDGQADTCHKLLLATGGERNHGMALARELGASENPVLPAYLRLRLASPKLADQFGPLEREVRIRCPRTGKSETGLVELSARGLEGPALSALSSSFCEDWKQRGYRLKLELDWIPSLKPSVIRSEVDSRCLTGRRKGIGDEALFGLSKRQWQGFLQLARIEPETPWLRLKARQLQSLVQRLKSHSVSFSGMGLPAGERASAGGIEPEEIDWSTGAAKSAPGVYYAGEILDVLGRPGGAHLNLLIGSAYLAGSAMALND